MLLCALDYGITERDFWDMTVIEVQRAVTSKEKVRKLNNQEKAFFDYNLAMLIGKAVSKVLGDKNDLPTIEEAYQSLFVEELAQKKAQEHKRKEELSIERFKQFAQSHNHKLRGGETNE